MLGAKPRAECKFFRQCKRPGDGSTGNDRRRPTQAGRGAELFGTANVFRRAEHPVLRPKAGRRQPSRERCRGSVAGAGRRRPARGRSRGRVRLAHAGRRFPRRRPNRRCGGAASAGTSPPPVPAQRSTHAERKLKLDTYTPIGSRRTTRAGARDTGMATCGGRATALRAQASDECPARCRLITRHRNAQAPELPTTSH